MPEKYDSKIEIQFLPLVFTLQDGVEVFRVTSVGEIVSNGVDITDDDAAIADCFRRWVRLSMCKGSS